MALRNGRRLRWSPKGLSDSLDGNANFAGAMAQLSNLIPDPSTANSWQLRPAAVSATNFPVINTPGFISGLLVVGDIAYGMIASATFPGKDFPFAYNIQTNAFLTVGGILSGNTPASPATSGDWTPPILAQVGSRIMVTHPGFPGGATKFGWFDISGFNSTTITGSTHGTTTLDTFSSNTLQAGWQPGMTIAGTDIPAGTTIVTVSSDGTQVTISNAATGTTAGVAFTVAGGVPSQPLWGAGDLNINPLPSVPVSVTGFNGRAYFACGTDGVVFSDSLVPCNRFNATQALLPANGLAVTALVAQQLTSALTGGIVQSIIAFQGVSAMIQIQGDPATNNLTINLMPVATGTNSPLSLTPCSLGTAFISPEGMRIITFSGQISDPIGDAGAGVTVPFLFAANPSRNCAAANADVIRISVKNASKANNPVEEYWYDLTRKIWSGPHTFPSGQIQPWRNTFLLAADSINGQLWKSDAVPSLTQLGTENGSPIAWVYQTVLLPDDDDMMMTAVIEGSIMVQLGSQPITATVVDDSGITLDTLSFGPAPGSTTQWDAFNWDQAIWDGPPSTFRQRALQWNVPLVFKQAAFQFSGIATAAFRISNLSLRYQRLAYQIEAA